MLRLIGPPTYTWHYFRPSPANTWLYRFETIQRCTLFEVVVRRGERQGASKSDYHPTRRTDEHF